MKVVQLPTLWRWEQHEGGGCRCVCAFYHPRRGLPGSVCLGPAEPGLLVRVETEGEVSGPLPGVPPVLRRARGVTAAPHRRRLGGRGRGKEVSCRSPAARAAVRRR
ncbi:DUF6372 family protein [Nocardia farcinica]|uniref:DUF6372 family protein n=1 Tax=Nocardia farcinica TaxID=37329 RepID=UPI003593DF23